MVDQVRFDPVGRQSASTTLTTAGSATATARFGDVFNVNGVSNINFAGEYSISVTNSAGAATAGGFATHILHWGFDSGFTGLTTSVAGSVTAAAHIFPELFSATAAATATASASSAIRHLHGSNIAIDQVLPVLPYVRHGVSFGISGGGAASASATITLNGYLFWGG